MPLGLPGGTDKCISQKICRKIRSRYDLRLTIQKGRIKVKSVIRYGTKDEYG